MNRREFSQALLGLGAATFSGSAAFSSQRRGMVSMKITDIKTVPVDRYLFVKIRTNGGITGLGESGAWGYLEASEKAIETFRTYLLTGESITDARVELERMGEPYVSLSFDSRGARVFERITGDNVGKRLAIVLDDKVYSAPVIRDKISGGKAPITGAFSMDDAKDLAIVLRAGALPAPVKILEERTVGPSLGKDSIDQGFTSMVIGLSIILILVAIYYRLSGIIAGVVLLLNIPFILGGLALFGATLTLPGIAGVILSIRW